MLYLIDVCVSGHICKRAQTGKMGERQQEMGGGALSDGRTKETTCVVWPVVLASLWTPVTSGRTQTCEFPQ